MLRREGITTSPTSDGDGFNTSRSPNRSNRRDDTCDQEQIIKEFKNSQRGSKQPFKREAELWLKRQQWAGKKRTDRVVAVHGPSREARPRPIGVAAFEANAGTLEEEQVKLNSRMPNAAQKRKRKETFNEKKGAADKKDIQKAERRTRKKDRSGCFQTHEPKYARLRVQQSEGFFNMKETAEGCVG